MELIDGFATECFLLREIGFLEPMKILFQEEEMNKYMASSLQETELQNFNEGNQISNGTPFNSVIL